MSEFEYLEVAQSLWGNAVSLMAIYITVLSGYLIIAYVAGTKLQVIQLRLINFIYVGFSSFLMLGYFGFAVNASEIEQIAFALTSQRQTPPTGFLGYILGAFMVLCLGVSLKFMRDIRREDGGV